MLHLLFANYVIKLFELMVVVCLKRHRMQVDSYIYNVNKLVKTKVQFHLIFQVFPQSPSLRLFFHQKSPLSKLKYCKHFTVGSNFSYGKLFRDMFPDSHIAKGYKQSETKIKYFIQFRIALYFIQALQDDFLGTAFSFKFDGTTSQVKKQYDGFIQYRSNSLRCIVISYCGSLFVDHCPFETLVEYLKN